MSLDRVEISHESGTSIQNARCLRSALMTQPHHHSAKALFRFSVVAKVLACMRTGMTRAQAIASVSAEIHILSNGFAKRVFPRSLYRWLADYKSHGVLGLEPKARMKESLPSVLSQTFIDFLVEEKSKDHRASVPELIRRARERGVLKVAETIDRSTVYRACRRLGLPLARCRHAKDRDSRRFAHPHRMDMVLCDGKHFRVGPQRRKRVALFFIDDATRLVLSVVVGTTGEPKELFLRGLYKCIHKFGLMTTVFVDNGPGFIAKDSLTIFANLGILLIHGERCYKEGHGKIERFNRTIKADVLRGLDGHPDVDSDCGALELRLAHYIEKIYADRPHEGIDGQTPSKRFSEDSKALRFPPLDEDLRRHFEVDIVRRVANDHVISIDGIDYEVPRGCAGRKITVRRRLLEDSIVYTHLGEVIELHSVDLVANARAKRAKGSPKPASDEFSDPPTTAAQSAFHDEFKPIVDKAGGFIGDLPTTDDQQDHPDQEQTQ